jgi:hypothetical protein
MRPEVQVLPGPPPALTSGNAGHRVRSWFGGTGARSRTLTWLPVLVMSDKVWSPCRVSPDAAALDCAICSGVSGGGAQLAFHVTAGNYDSDTLIEVLLERRRFLRGEKATLLWDGRSSSVSRVRVSFHDVGTDFSMASSCLRDAQLAPRAVSGNNRRHHSVSRWGRAPSFCRDVRFIRSCSRG